MNVRILREAGGIGDILCTLPVARAVKEKWPDAKVYYFGLRDYREVQEHCPDVDVLVPVECQGRRERDTAPDPKLHSYLAAPGLPAFDVTIDLWCPAARYEREKGEHLDRSRIESFCAAAGLTPSDYVPRYIVREEERAWAKTWLGADVKRPVIGLAPFCTNNIRRDWPLPRWVELAKALGGQGMTVLVFHTWFSAVADVPGRKVIGIPVWQLGALVAECDLVVTPDSGLFHLSAAVHVPAIGLFGSTHADQISKHYPLHKTIWPRDGEKRAHKCKPPCMMFEWLGCDNQCRTQGCEVLQKITTEEVLNAVKERIRP